ncbi:DNase I-like protein [Rhizophagus irregularis]|nr:DNase I-like protein [Rhizophagus irregularis]
MEYTNKRKNAFDQDTQTTKHIRLINYSPSLTTPTDNYLLSSPTPLPTTHDRLKEVALLEDDTINLMDMENTNNYNNTNKRKTQIENETSNTDHKKKSRHINYNNNQLLYNEENITNKIVINNLAKDEYFIDYLKIGTINIQSAYQRKKMDIVNYFVTHNYDILGLTETAYQMITDNKLLEIIPHPYITNEKIFIIHDTNGNTSGSGVSIMMTQQIYQHNHYSSTFEGRVCNVKLGFKGSKTLDITCCYLPASTNKTSSDIKIKCVNEIKKIIGKYKNKQHYGIIIGDFNCPPKEKTNINHQVIIHLKSNNFTDLAKFHAQEKEPDITHKVNRIDYHFGNEELLKNSIHSFTQGIPVSFFKMDHKAVITLLDRSFWTTSKYRYNRTAIPHNINDKKKELKYVYDDMTPELWANYKDQSRKIFTKTFKKFNCQNVNNLEHLNHMWNKIEDCIIKIKKDNITQ